MKKWIALILVLLLALTAAACSSGKKDSVDSKESSEETADVKQLDDETKENLESMLKKMAFKGIVYLTQNGSEIFRYESGENEEGDPLSVDSTMYIGSVSKQFCAASIMILRDEGKLSVDDTLDKYFPEYEAGKTITVQNLLSMRSGIPDMVNEGTVTELSLDNTAEENNEIIKKWIFERELKFEPDSNYAYSNSNYFLLGNIVEQVSGQSYIDYVRKNIFDPLGMTHSGFVDEVKDTPDWAAGLKPDESGMNAPGLTKGAGDILSNAPDMEKWMDGLSSGKLISEESFKEMTADYSTDNGINYGYGLNELYRGGTGHGGLIGVNNLTYSAVDYINIEEGYRMFAASNNAYMQIEGLPAELLEEIME